MTARCGRTPPTRTWSPRSTSRCPSRARTTSRCSSTSSRRPGPGVVANPGPRYFGFVTGGALPAALGADWLTSAWDQNAFSRVSSPAAAAIEAVAERWVLEALGLPRTAAVGFATGATTSNFTCIAAARHALLERAGWDVEEQRPEPAPRRSA